MNKIFWIQNDLFAKWYVRDGEEFKEDFEEREVEQEGYVNGKKVIDSDSDGEKGAEGEGESVEELKKRMMEGGCPFAGMVRDVGGAMPADHPKVPEQKSGIPRLAKAT